MVIDVHDSVKRELRRRKYSEKTIKTYLYCIDKFFSKCHKTIDKISKKEIKEFLNEISKKGKAGNTINVYLNALKFFFEEILGKKMKLNIKYSKIPKKIPLILTKQEIKNLFDFIENKKYRLMTKLMYSAGLRVSELINLKIKDLEIDDGYGWVRKGKGKKDRLFIIAESLKDEIRKFIGSKKLDEYGYLFVSNRRDKYSIRTLQSIIKKAVKKAGLDKKISCHTLRHSFATHLIEDGYSVSEVQSLLGHTSPKTTFTYLHTSAPNLINVKSPIDDL